MKLEMHSYEDAHKEGDRFKDLADNYGDLFIEVSNELGEDDEKFQKTIVNAVKSIDSKYIKKPILDIGCGDGLTLKAFQDSGCVNLTGLDLNEEMLRNAHKRLGKNVRLIKADARKMPFAPNAFPIIISSKAIHNISREERKKVWSEVLRLKPEIFVNADKIMLETEEKHKKAYERELAAIKKIFLFKYGMEKVYETWVEHYENDERERLEMDEIKEALGQEYNIKSTYEKGMFRTILAVKKKAIL
jgi:ubiquinone/menaquinone biosynthesis C-methylase UbiE